jgi:phage baseplate assembly protein W
MAIKGIAFPFRKSATSFPATVDDSDVIKDNITRILQTIKGERVMRPKSGSGVWSFVFDNTGPIFSARMDHEVRRAIAEGEPRAVVLNVSTGEEERKDGGTNVVVTVTFAVNNDVSQTQAIFSQTGG